VFDQKEKAQLKCINGKLIQVGSAKYDKGLLLAFYYAVPNNTMPIIWKEGQKYNDNSGNTRNWFALLPRKY
jgi:hypothetical protein